MTPHIERMPMPNMPIVICPCGLSQDRVLEVAEKHGVPLLAGRCQNPLADGTEGTCGKALGAHPLSLGNHFFESYVLPRFIYTLCRISLLK